MQRRPHLHLVICTIGLSLFVTAASVEAQQQTSTRTSDQQPCVVVMGAVSHATQVELRRPLRLMEALFLAGGLTEGAGETIKVLHGSPKTRCEPIPDWAWDKKTDEESESYSVAALKRDEERANPSILPGDIIIVSYAPSIYIVGNVANPREIFPKKPVTLTQLLDLAGGVLPHSRRDQIKIYRRRQGQEPVIITVDLGKIKRHRAVDPVLQANDIVDVPAKLELLTDRLSAGIVP